MSEIFYRPETWLAAAPLACHCLTANMASDLVMVAGCQEDAFLPLWSSHAEHQSLLSTDRLVQLARQVAQDRSPVCLPEWSDGGSILAVPLPGLPDDAAIMLLLWFATRRPLVARDVRYAADLAGLLAEAGRGAWLREKLFQPVQDDDASRTRRPQQRATYLEALNFISESARDGMMFNEIAKHTMHRLTAGLGIEYGALYFGLDGAWILVEHVGFDERFPLAAGYLPATLLPWTMLSEPACEFDPGQPLAGLLEAAQVKSWITVPLIESSEVRGGLILATAQPTFFTPELVTMLARISQQLQAAMLQARLSRELSEQTADLQTVIGSLSDALLEVTADRSVMQANLAAAELLGVRAGGPRADDWQHLLPLYDMHHGEPAGEEHPIARTFGQATRQPPSQWRLVRDGRTAYVSVTASPIMDEKTLRVRAAVLVVRDITELRAAEQKLLAAEKHASVSSLAAGVAHEFKNYLAGMMGNASLAQRAGRDPEAVRTALERIVEIGARANLTALSLLSYVRDANDLPQILDLGNLTREVICLMEQRAIGQGIRVVRALDLDVCVDGAATKVRQVLLNLLDNAVEAMPQGGTLTLTLKGAAMTATLKIEDTGVGIAPEDMGRVFDPFFSTKGVWGRETGSGNGLGLTTSSNYVREMKGELSLKSAQGVGTEVTIRLPRVDHARNESAAASGASRSRRAFIFETDTDTRELLASTLKDQAWQVTVVDTASEFSTHLQEEPPGVVFLDALMPGKLNFIRAFDSLHERAPDCRVVVTTGEATDYQLAEYIQSASARLVKPLSPDHIRQFVQTRLR